MVFVYLLTCLVVVMHSIITTDFFTLLNRPLRNDNHFTSLIESEVKKIYQHKKFHLLQKTSLAL